MMYRGEAELASRADGMYRMEGHVAHNWNDSNPAGPNACRSGARGFFARRLNRLVRRREAERWETVNQFRRKS